MPRGAGHLCRGQDLSKVLPRLFCKGRVEKKRRQTDGRNCKGLSPVGVCVVSARVEKGAEHRLFQGGQGQGERRILFRRMDAPWMRGTSGFSGQSFGVFRSFVFRVFCVLSTRLRLPLSRDVGSAGTCTAAATPRTPPSRATSAKWQKPERVNQITRCKRS